MFLLKPFLKTQQDISENSFPRKSLNPQKKKKMAEGSTATTLHESVPEEEPKEQNTSGQENDNEEREDSERRYSQEHERDEKSSVHDSSDDDIWKGYG